MNPNYFIALAEQMQKAGIEDSSDATIYAKEGEPAIVIISNGIKQQIFRQDMELTKLELVSCLKLDDAEGIAITIHSNGSETIEGKNINP